MLLSLWRLLFQAKTATPVPPKVEERLAEVERELHSVKLEWLDTLDKVERWMHRSIKRAPIEPPPEQPPAPADEMPGVDPISATLLRRRGRVRGVGNGP